MNKYEIVKKIIKDNNGMAKTADFVAAGLKNYDIAPMCNQGKIVRIKHGYYALPKADDISDEQLISRILPQGIICVESALFHYGYSDFSPREWSIAVPRFMSRKIKQTTEVFIKAYFVQDKYLYIGKTTDNFNGITLPVYDRERTICDCFRYRNKLDNEIFNKAINAYVADDKKNLANLSRYAKEMRVYNKLMNIMEVMLNG